ncbi:MAG: nucleotidyltransferase family protein [Bacteroidales bacterium]|nr:nucleotidyltransferase family protein [Bacteroidales bacterium]MCF8333023.1 nucleotidyltransferase family protein [Bacteroidales bacterium]
MEAIILVGGLGTRLRPVVSDIPKAMAPVNGRPFLEYQLAYLKNNGISRVILAVGYKKDSIISHFGNEFLQMEIAYAKEEEPLGTGGAILNALPLVREQQFFILNGDTMFEISLDELQKVYWEKKADLTLALRKVKDISRYGAVTIDDNGRINGFLEKGEAKGKGLINGGIYFGNRKFFEQISYQGKFSFEKEVLEKEYRHKKFYGVGFENYFLDIGIPNDYKRAQHEFKRLGY